VLATERGEVFPAEARERMISRQRQVSDSHTSQGIPMPESRDSRGEEYSSRPGEGVVVVSSGEWEREILVKRVVPEGGRMERLSSAMGWGVAFSRRRGRSWMKATSFAMSGTASLVLPDRVGRMVLRLERRVLLLTMLPWGFVLACFVVIAAGTGWLAGELSLVRHCRMMLALWVSTTSSSWPERKVQ